MSVLAYGGPVVGDGIQAVIELTNRCNSRCRHCASSSGQARAQELTADDWLPVVADLKHLGCTCISLIGGEVFLANWRPVAEAVRAHGIHLVVITNGLAVDAALRRDLLRIGPTVVGVSLDAADPATYREIRGVDGLGRAWSTLCAFRDEGFSRPTAVTTFMRRNLDGFAALADRLTGSGLRWQIQVAARGGERFGDDDSLDPEGYGRLGRLIADCLRQRREALPIEVMDDVGYFPRDPAFRFLHQRWQGCQAGRRVVGIRANGDVLGCLSLGDAYVEANLRQVPLREIWASGRYFGRLRNKTLTGHCATCPHAVVCQAGCPRCALGSSGDIGCNHLCLREHETREALAI